MIKINLLPVEKRKTERTPLPRMMLIIATAAVAAIAVLVNVVVYFQILGVERDIEDRKNTLVRLEPKVKEHDRLQARVAQLKAKVSEIESLVKREVEHWRAVNALWDVIQASPKVWVDDLRILDGTAASGELKRIDPEASGGSPYGVTMRCHVAGEEVSEMTAFRTKLKENRFLKEYLSTVNFNVDWKVDPEKDFAEENSISFAVSLLGPMVPPTKVKPPGAIPAKAGAAPTAPAGSAVPAGGNTK